MNNTILYVYRQENAELMVDTLSEYKFINISLVIHMAPNIDDIYSLDEAFINNTVIDITNWVMDVNLGNVFLGKFIYAISNEFENIHFSLQSDYYNIFEKRYPFIFDKEYIDNNYNTVKEKAKTKIHAIISSPIPIYFYNKKSTIIDLISEKKAVSLSELAGDNYGITYKFDYKYIENTILENHIEYIDLTNVIREIKTKEYLIFSIEMAISKIKNLSNIKFSIQESELDFLLECFVFIFDQKVIMDKDKKERKDTNAFIYDPEDLKQHIANIEEILRGHTDFKKSFRLSMLKFAVLNKLGERKIQSVFICGESGIGKTEFAKILSNELFHEEPYIKINLGNYSNEGVLNSLIGSPLGYVGSEEGGELINKIKTSGTKVILIDEFERATPSVHNFFYELLEDGKFTDRKTVEHDLNGYIIVFTSNFTPKEFYNNVPPSLISRFDLIYNFVDVPVDDKEKYIQDTSKKLIEKINDEFEISMNDSKIQEKLLALSEYKNLRDMKRHIEDIVIEEFYQNYYNG